MEEVIITTEMDGYGEYGAVLRRMRDDWLVDIYPSTNIIDCDGVYLPKPEDAITAGAGRNNAAAKSTLGCPHRTV